MASKTSAPKKWVVICCPVAGKKQGQQIVETVFVPAMKELGVPVEVLLTKSKGHATELAKTHGSADCGLVAVGGDGTIHEVMDGLIEKGILADVPLGLLSQGTMNFYAISGGLPDAAGLPKLIANNSVRRQGLMRCSSDSGIQPGMMCFEALYFGVGYKPAKGAQEWRSSMGPMFGIMLNLVKACAFPSSNAAITGKLSMTPADGGKDVVLDDTFFWIIVTQRSPYNGTLTDDMWVSWLTLEDYPGFGRMMDFFAPEMECFSGLVAAFSGHMKCKKFVWNQDKAKSGPIGVCLDGDPVEAGQVFEVEHCPKAWSIVAEPKYPDKICEEKTTVGWITAPAQKWLNENPPPKGTYVQPFKPKPPPKSNFGRNVCLTILAASMVGFFYFRWSSAGDAGADGEL